MRLGTDSSKSELRILEALSETDITSSTKVNADETSIKPEKPREPWD